MTTGLTQQMDTSTLSQAPETADEVLKFDREAIALQVYHDIVEDAVRDSHHVQAALNSVGGSRPPPPLVELQAATCTNPLRRLLACAALDPTTSDHYLALGLSRLEGPANTRKKIEDRGRVGQELIEIGTATGMGEAARGTIRQWAVRIQEAVAHCILDLGEANAARRSLKGEPKSLEQWKELGSDFLHYLHAETEGAGASGRIVTQLSNVAGIDLSQLTLVASPQESRTLQSTLCGHPNQIENLFKESEIEHIVAWAPSDSGQTQKVALAFRNTMGNRRRLGAVSLLVPISRVDGCKTAEEILDLWTYPLLGPKWEDIVIQVHLFSPPVPMVITGPYAPLHTQRSLAIFTLGSNPNQPKPSIQTWSITLHSQDAFETLVVDVPEGHRWKVYKLLKEFQISGVRTIDAPIPSAGSQKLDSRSVIRVYLSRERCTGLLKESVRRWVQRQLITFQALVGWASMMNDTGTMLLDVTQVSAGCQFTDLCNGMLTYSSRLIIVDTRAEEGTWSMALTDTWKRNPLVTGEKLRFRASSGRGGVFAAVQATAAQIAGAKARSGHAAVTPTKERPQTLQATIDIPVGACGNFEQWVPEVMDKIATATAIRLTHSQREDGLGFGEWKLIFDAEGRWLRKILVQVQDAQQLRGLHKLLQTARVSIEGHEAALEISSRYVALAGQGSGN